MKNSYDSRRDFSRMFSVLRILLPLVLSSGCNFSPSYTPKFTTPTEGQHFKVATTSIAGTLTLSLTPDQQKQAEAEIAKGKGGIFDPPGTTYLNGQAATKDGFGFTYDSFPLKPGANTITAKYVGTFSSRETSITVYYDGAAPIINVTAPTNGSTVQSQTVDVTGSVSLAPAGATIFISDSTSGSVVHGTIAPNGVFTATGLNLALGKNQITVQALQGTTVVASSNISVMAQMMATQTMSASGGQVSLPGIASVVIPAGAFAANTEVSILQTLSPVTQALYTDSTEIFLAGSAAAYEVRINTGDNPINDGINSAVTIDLQDTYLNALPTQYGIQAFVQFVEESDTESYDHFEIIASTFDANSKTLTVSVPDYAFTNVRTADQSYEAIIMIGTSKFLGGGRIRSNPIQAQLPSVIAPYDASTCAGNPIAPPLAGNPVASSPFNPAARKAPHKAGHWGIDYPVISGTSVFAATDGIVHVRSNPKGYGTYVILEGPSGQTLYGHLQTVLIPDGKPATQGQMIALSDSGGDATAAHLHFEYAPDGDIFNKILPNRVDPAPCISDAKFTLTPNHLSFQISSDGSNPVAQPVVLINSGSRSINPVINIVSPPAPWLKISGLESVGVAKGIPLSVSVISALVPFSGDMTTVTIADSADLTIFQTLQIQVSRSKNNVLDPTQWQPNSAYSPSAGEYYFSNSVSPNDTLFRITDTVAPGATFSSEGISFVLNSFAFFQIAGPGTTSETFSLASPISDLECATSIVDGWTDYTKITSLMTTLTVQGPYGDHLWPTIQCNNDSDTPTTVLISNVSVLTTTRSPLVEVKSIRYPIMAPGTILHLK